MRIRFHLQIVTLLLLLSAVTVTYGQVLVPTTSSVDNPKLAISYKSSRPGNIFLAGDTAQFKITVTHIPDTVKNIYFHWQIFNIENKLVSEKEEHLTRWQNGGFIYPIFVNHNLNGWYQLQITLRDGEHTLLTQKINLAWISAPPATGFDSSFGVDLNLAELSSAQTENSGQLMELAGIHWIRQEFEWRKIQPQPDQWDWKDSDNAAISAKRFHLDTLGVLNHCPDWSKSSTGDRNKLFAEFVSQVITRYKDKIKSWEIPINFTDDSSTTTPEQYAGLLKTAFRAAKDADPQCNIIVPARWDEDTTFINQLLKAGGGDSLDGIVLHPNQKQITENTAQVSQLLEQYGKGKEIWLTGIGWPTHSSDNPGEDSYTAQASALVRSYILSCYSATADKVFWNTFRDSGSSTEDMKHLEGILESDFSPKPSYVALANMARQLNGYDFVSTLNLGNDCSVYAFKKDNQSLLVAWRTSGSVTVGMKSDANSLKVTDLYGNTITLLPIDKDISVTLTDSPVYISGDFTELKDVSQIINLKLPVSQVQQGQGLDMGIELRNIFSKDLIGNLAVKISDSINRNIIGEEQEKFVTIKPGEEKEIQYKLNISDSATVGLTPLEVQLDTKDGGTFKLQTELKILKKKPTPVQDTTANSQSSNPPEK